MGEAKRVREATAAHTTISYTAPRACPNCEDEMPFRVVDDDRREWLALHCSNCSYGFTIRRVEREGYKV